MSAAHWVVICTGNAGDGVTPGLLGPVTFPSETAARRAALSDAAEVADVESFPDLETAERETGLQYWIQKVTPHQGGDA